MDVLVPRSAKFTQFLGQLVVNLRVAEVILICGKLQHFVSKHLPFLVLHLDLRLTSVGCEEEFHFHFHFHFCFRFHWSIQLVWLMSIWHWLILRTFVERMDFLHWHLFTAKQIIDSIWGFGFQWYLASKFGFDLRILVFKYVIKERLHLRCCDDLAFLFPSSGDFLLDNGIVEFSYELFLFFG